MGIFSRFRDIVNANINAMLDRAEDPEKLIRLMIQEMEDTLVEMKASCASAMAGCKKVSRARDEAGKRSQDWEEKARLAVDKGREDLAREALVERRRWLERAQVLEQEVHECEALIANYQEEIRQLEEKLAATKEKQRLLVQRHVHAFGRRRAQEELRRLDSSDAWIRFEQFENRIERMEAEADLVNAFRRPSSLEDQFDRLKKDEDVEAELEALKTSLKKDSGETAV